MKPRGIAFKTFLFTSVLITFILIFSFGILYFTMPGYYLYMKEKEFDRNSQQLAETLRSSDGISTDTIYTISTFSQNNNAEVFVFDAQDALLPGLSSPFLWLDNSVIYNIEYISEDTGAFSGSEIISSYITISEKNSATSISNRSGQEGDASIAVMKLKTSIELDKNSLSKTFFIDSGNIGEVIISSTLQPVDEAKNVILSLIPYLLLADIFIVLIAAYVFAKQFTKPILAISVAAEKMQSLQEGITSNVGTRDELGQLSQNLDTLYTKLCININNLKEEMEKTSRLEQSKTDFMRAASHELKTPITALAGITEGMLDNVGIYKNRDKYLVECKSLITRLSQLVQEILQASKLEALEENINYGELNLEDLWDQAKKLYNINIEEKGLVLHETPFHYTCYTGKQMLFTILSNLLSNAVRYTPENGNIYVYLKGCTFSIENDCPPIPEEELERMFEPFYTLDYSRNKNISGTGLGLYIVKQNLDKLQIPYTCNITNRGFIISLHFEP